MIISNPSQKLDLDRKAITTLGDSLYNRGDLFGAQFCYLMAQVGFGKYSNVNQETALMFNSNNTIRLILLGSSHHKNFIDFASNDAIIMTEIYEYACTLNDDKFSISEFQPYKYLLATRMLDYGFYLKTLMYMEQISKHIELDPSKYTSDFITKIFTLGDRLKYHDPGLEKTLDELNEQGSSPAVEDQKWLQNLYSILVNVSQYQASQPDQQINQNTDSYYQDQMKSQIDQQFVELNQQFSELNMQYTNQSHNNEQSNNNYGYQSNLPSQPEPVNNEVAFNQPSTGYYDPNQHQPLSNQSDNVDHYGASPMQDTQPEQENIDYYSQHQQQQSYPLPVDPNNQNQSYDYWNQQQHQNAEVSLI